METAVSALNDGVAEEVRVALTRRRLRQSHLAKQLGENEAWVSRRLAGRRLMTLQDVERIAAALEMPVAELLPQGVRVAPSGRLARPGVITGRKPGVSRPKRQVPPARPGRTSRIRQTT